MQGLESSKAQSAVKGGGLRDCVCLVCKNSEKSQLNKAKVSSRLENLLFLMLSQHQGCDSHRELSADQQCGEQISPGVGSVSEDSLCPAPAKHSDGANRAQR